MQLTAEDRAKLRTLLSGRIQPVRTVRSTWMLLQWGERKLSPQIAAHVGVVVNI